MLKRRMEKCIDFLCIIVCAFIGSFIYDKFFRQEAPIEYNYVTYNYYGSSEPELRVGTCPSDDTSLRPRIFTQGKLEGDPLPQSLEEIEDEQSVTSRSSTQSQEEDEIISYEPRVMPDDHADSSPIPDSPNYESNGDTGQSDERDTDEVKSSSSTSSSQEEMSSTDSSSSSDSDIVNHWLPFGEPQVEEGSTLRDDDFVDTIREREGGHNNHDGKSGNLRIEIRRY